MFLVKREESRNFDVLFVCFLCLKEKKNEQKASKLSIGTRETSFLVWKVPGTFYSLGVNFKVVALVGPLPPSKGHRLG